MKEIKIGISLFLLFLASCNTCKLNPNRLSKKGIIRIPSFTLVYENLSDCASSDSCKNIDVISVYSDGKKDTLCVPERSQDEKLFGTDCVVSLNYPVRAIEKKPDTIIVSLKNRKDFITDVKIEYINDCDGYIWNVNINGKNYEVHPGDYISMY